MAKFQKKSASRIPCNTEDELEVALIRRGGCAYISLSLRKAARSRDDFRMDRNVTFQLALLEIVLKEAKELSKKV